MRFREGLMGRAALNRVLCLAPTKAAAASLEPSQDGGMEWMPGAHPGSEDSQ